MISILNFLFFILIVVSLYLIFELGVFSKINKKLSKYIELKNEKYYKNLLNYYSKNKKVKLNGRLNFLYQLSALLDHAGIKSNILINPIMLILYSFICFILTFMVVYSIIKIIMLSIMISLPVFAVPSIILKVIANKKNNLIEEGALNFILQLKNYTKINNDIIFAFKQVKTNSALQSYINEFLVEVNSGIKFEKAVENIKEKIPTQVLKNLFSNIEYCYIYGGDFSELMNKSYQIISKVQKEKRTRENETQSARIVLVILIVLDLFVYFNFIKSNQENYTIMTKSFFGVLILYWNFISIWILMFLMNRVKKLDY